ncbi:MAG TPA: metallophosphoesterase [Planctomycetota bacterium]|nr:metallophosphoesterase [Planctomycetota bacterium]
MKILAISDLHGQVDALNGLRAKIQEEHADMVVFTGDVVKMGARTNEWLNARKEGRAPNRHLDAIREQERANLLVYQAFFKTLADANRLSFVIPGNLDAPLDLFLQMAVNREVVSRKTYIVHGRITTKFTTPRVRDMYVCGFGGEITEHQTELDFILAFSRPHILYAAESFVEFPGPKAMLLHTPPKLMTPQGSEVVEEIIDTVRPSHAFVGQVGDLQGERTVGTTFVVCPGALMNGDYAVVDNVTNRVQYKKLEAGVAV